MGDATAVILCLQGVFEYRTGAGFCIQTQRLGKKTTCRPRGQTPPPGDARAYGRDLIGGGHPDAGPMGGSGTALAHGGALQRGKGLTCASGVPDQLN